MKATKYAVVWHEINDTGSPRHVMGMSPMFDTRTGAEDWVKSTIAEDNARSRETDDKELAVYTGADGEGVTTTRGNQQTTYYEVEEIEWDDKAAECLMKVQYMLEFGKDPAKKLLESAKAYLKKHETDYLPLREWAVDIRFSPAACVHHVVARTGEEAERKVSDMLDNGGVERVLSDSQLKELVGDLIENVESIDVVGPDEDYVTDADERKLFGDLKRKKFADLGGTPITYKGNQYMTWKMEVADGKYATFADIRLWADELNNGDLGNSIDDQIAFYVALSDYTDDAIRDFNA